MNKYEDNEIKHVKNGELEYLQFKALNDLGIRHCITLRHGGVSKGDYESLNFRTAGEDGFENVMENLRRVKISIGVDNVCKGRQAHTDRVIEINKGNFKDYLVENRNKEEVDGYVVKDGNIATLITTADCNPVIIYDKVQNIYANVHAGWKGVLKKIYLNAINFMIQKYNSNVEDLIVCIGPSLRACCFTSKDESFKKQFEDVYNYSDEYLYYDEDNITFHIDMIKIMKKEMKNVGILESNIHVADICTRTNCDDFFSYRKARQSEKKDFGTMATIVSL